MKNKCSVLIFIVVFSMILTGCTTEPTNSEDVTNLIEAYIFARSNGDMSLKTPNISKLSVDKKSDIVNALSFDIVFKREDELIAFLNDQWLDWRSDKGYIITYLNNRLELNEKRLKSIEDTRKSVKVEADYPDIMTFYKAIGSMLKNQTYDLDNLYVASGSQSFQFEYSVEGVHLIKASAVVFDMKKSDYFTAVFENRQLVLTPVDTREMASDNMSIKKAQTTPFIDMMLSLIPWPENGNIMVSYTFFKQESTSPYLKALLIGGVYKQVDKVSDVYENGYLQLSSETYPTLPQFMLYRPKVAAN